MPKCSLQSTNYEAENRRMRAAIMYKQEIKNVSTSELAVYAHLKVSTMYQRLQNPADFRIKELRGICKRLDIDILQLLNGNELCIGREART